MDKIEYACAVERRRKTDSKVYWLRSVATVVGLLLIGTVLGGWYMHYLRSHKEELRNRALLDEKRQLCMKLNGAAALMNPELCAAPVRKEK